MHSASTLTASPSCATPLVISVPLGDAVDAGTFLLAPARMRAQGSSPAAPNSGWRCDASTAEVPVPESHTALIIKGAKVVYTVRNRDGAGQGVALPRGVGLAGCRGR